MACLEIRAGLKKLEFERLPTSSDEATRAVVEFVREVPWPCGQSARVALGRHNGVLRELVGIPELVGTEDTQNSRGPGRQYLYRLRGAITAAKD
jgi:hypothetical protein